MTDLQKLPAVLTAKEIRTHLWNCSSTTVREAFLAGKIKGRPISTRRILYETQSVLEWLGLAPEGPQPRLPMPGKMKKAAAKEKASKTVPAGSEF